MLRARSRRSVAASRRSSVSKFIPSPLMTEPLERRALLSGVVMGITPGSTAAGIDFGTIVDDDGGAAMTRQYGTAYAMSKAPKGAAASAAPAGGTFNLDLKPGPNLQANPQALAAFEQAASFFESIFSDPITVVIDADLANLGSSTLGLASSVIIGDTYDTIRDRMVSDAHPDEAAFLQQLPSESGYYATLPTSATFSVNGMGATRANLLALGVPASELPGPASEFAPGVTRDAKITFSSQYPWDFDRSNGISSGLNDFVGVAIHEIGHALGFNSGVDTVDSRYFSGGDVAPMPLDLFRMEPGAAGGGFGSAWRVLAPGNTVANQVFHDGGTFNPGGIVQIPGLLSGDIPLSTGAVNSPLAHRQQASHWKDETLIGGLVNTIGAMDPTATTGRQQDWTANDTRAMSLVGWDAAPPPAGTGIFGTVFEDANGNGVFDGGELGLQDWRVYHDVNNNGQYDVTPGSTTTRASTDVPKNIPDGSGSAQSILNVSGVTGVVSDIDVTLNISHTWDEDLIISLIGPDGTRVTLASERGNDGDNYSGTVFDDEASQHISGGNPPFAGRFQPEGQLTSFDGINPNGTWTLEVRDTVDDDLGRINSWSITLSSANAEPSTLTAADGTYSFDFAPGNYTLRQVVQQNFRQTLPANNGARQVTLAEGQSVTGVDFGNQGIAPTRVTGTVYEDVNPDGRYGDGDLTLFNWRVYQDRNNNGQYDSGKTTIEAREEDVNQTIWDFEPARSPIHVSGLTGTVRDVDVTLEIGHAWTPDIDVFLISPQGTRIRLLNQEGDLQNHEDFFITHLDDEADRSLDQGAPPYDGDFRPRTPLSNFDGQAMNGTWTLEVIDYVPQDHGAIAGWSLTFETGEAEPSVMTDGSGNYEFSNLPPGTYRLRTVLQPPYTSYVEPPGGVHVVNLAEGQTAVRNFGVGQGTPAAFVQGRHIFYNNSAFDGRSAAANAADDNAIAPDKVALQPGQTAGFLNYTSYSRGINGIMIDIAGLPAGAETSLTAADFGLRVGNDNNPAGWGAAPNPTISVRRGAGVGGSDRVTLTWPDGAIRGKWLQVNVQPNDRTGLAAQDTFYFGNLPGETGNNAANAATSPTDYIASRNRYAGSGAEMDDAYDFNRDGRVNAADTLYARRYMGKSIVLLSAPAAPPAGSNFSDAAIPPPPADALSTQRVWDETPEDVLA